MPEAFTISVSYYVTDEAASVDDAASTATKSEAQAAADDLVSKLAGRPDLSAVVGEFCAEPGSVAIASTSLTSGWKLRDAS